MKSLFLSCALLIAFATPGLARESSQGSLCGITASDVASSISHSDLTSCRDAELVQLVLQIRSVLWEKVQAYERDRQEGELADVTAIKFGLARVELEALKRHIAHR